MQRHYHSSPVGHNVAAARRQRRLERGHVAERLGRHAVGAVDAAGLGAAVAAAVAAAVVVAAVVAGAATMRGQPADTAAGERKRVGSALGAWRAMMTRFGVS